MEVWKQFRNTNYSVSNTGLVRNDITGRILKNRINTHGYYFVDLFIDKKRCSYNVHILVAIVFLGHIPKGKTLVINHIDFNKLNNHVSNLEIVTMRENSNRKHIPHSSSYIGVHWCKKDQRWRAIIKIGRKAVFLGNYKTELEAHKAYQEALLSLDNK